VDGRAGKSRRIVRCDGLLELPAPISPTDAGILDRRLPALQKLYAF
jgi:hypothetical protein